MLKKASKQTNKQTKENNVLQHYKSQMPKTDFWNVIWPFPTLVLHSSLYHLRFFTSVDNLKIQVYNFEDARMTCQTLLSES